MSEDRYQRVTVTIVMEVLPGTDPGPAVNAMIEAAESRDDVLAAWED